MKLNFKNKKTFSITLVTIFFLSMFVFGVKNVDAAVCSNTQKNTCNIQGVSATNTGNSGNVGGMTAYWWKCGTTPCHLSLYKCSYLNSTGMVWVEPDSSVTYYNTTSSSNCSSVSQSRKCNGLTGTFGGDSTYQYLTCSVAANCTGPDGTPIPHNSSKTYYNTTSSSNCSSASVSQTRTCNNGTLSGTYTNAICGAPCTGPDRTPIPHNTSKRYYNTTSAPNCLSTSVYQDRTCNNGTLSGTYTNAICNTLAQCTQDTTTIDSGLSAIFYSTTTSSNCSSTSVSQSRTCTNGTLGGNSDYQYSSCFTLAQCDYNSEKVNSGSTKDFYSTKTSSNCPSVSQTKTCDNGTFTGGDAQHKYTTCDIPPTPSPSNLFGWAWSSTIGWISMSGNGYGITIDSNNNFLSGYAWSNNIGWIQFGGLTGFPATGSGTTYDNAKYNSDKTLTGWAKATSAGTSDWDGWIALSGTGYGVKLDGSSSSWAWGSDVLGWIDFSRATTTAVTIVTYDGVCTDYSANTSSPQLSSLSSTNDSLCSSGTATSPVEERLTAFNFTVNNPFDYKYTWNCLGTDNNTTTDDALNCFVTTDNQRFSGTGPAFIGARLSPSIVNKGETCKASIVESSSVLDLINASSTCAVYKDSDSTLTSPIDSNKNPASTTQADWPQVDPGNDYKVACKNKEDSSVTMYLSKTLKCLLNPTVKEI